MKKIFACICLLLAVAAGCSRNDGLEKYADSQGEFEIGKPAGWQVREGVPGVLAVFESPLDPNGDTFAENIGVAAAEPGKKGTMIELLAEARDDLKGIFSNFELVSEDNFALPSGLPARRMVYRGNIGETVFQCGQVYVHAGSKVYALTLTATPDSFAVFEPVFLRSAESFKLK